MAIDSTANAAYRKANDKPFAVGQVVWISGIEFRVVEVGPNPNVVANGQLVLTPVTAKV